MFKVYKVTMGKTYKNGYKSLGHSFNSLKKFQCEKQYFRRKRKMEFRNNCDSMISECNSGEKANVSVSKLAPKRGHCRRPNKIGYCANSSESLSDIKNRIRSNYVDYTYKKFDSEYGCYRNVNSVLHFGNLSEKEQVDCLIEMEKERLKRWSEADDLNKIKKQLQRRGKTGYFKGHVKNTKINDFDCGFEDVKKVKKINKFNNQNSDLKKFYPLRNYNRYEDFVACSNDNDTYWEVYCTNFNKYAIVYDGHNVFYHYDDYVYWQYC